MRQIKDANASLYQDVKAGRRSLNGALAEISPRRDTRFREFGLGKSGAASQELDGRAQNEMRDLAQQAGGKVARGAQTGGIFSLADRVRASKEAAAVKLPPSPAAIEKALARINAILGNWVCAEVKAGNLIQKPEEIVQFAKLTDAQMLEIGPLLKKGWIFVAAFHEVIERLTPDDEIRALHTRAVANGGNWCLLSVGISGMLWCGGRKKIKLSPRSKTLWSGEREARPESLKLSSQASL